MVEKVTQSPRWCQALIIFCWAVLIWFCHLAGLYLAPGWLNSAIQLIGMIVAGIGCIFFMTTLVPSDNNSPDSNPAI